VSVSFASEDEALAAGHSREEIAAYKIAQEQDLSALSGALPSGATPSGATPKSSGATPKSPKIKQQDKKKPPANQGRALRRISNWKVKDPPLYNCKFVTWNGRHMLSWAMERRPWWGETRVGRNDKKLHGVDDHCRLFWNYYLRPDHCDQIRRSVSRDRLKGTVLPHPNIAYNHLEWNRWLTSKKGLYLSLDAFCKRTAQPLEKFTPTTFFLLDDAASAEMQRFEQYTRTLSNKDKAGLKLDQGVTPESLRAGDRNFWILKPAAGSNCGDGIRMLAGDDVVGQVQEIIRSGGEKDVKGGGQGGIKVSGEKNERGWRHFGWIVQKYIERPLLVHSRKFDIRCYILLVMRSDDGDDGGGDDDHGPSAAAGNGNNSNNKNPSPNQSSGRSGGGSGGRQHQKKLVGYLYNENYLRTSSTPVPVSQSRSLFKNKFKSRHEIVVWFAVLHCPNFDRLPPWAVRAERVPRPARQRGDAPHQRRDPGTGKKEPTQG
jgi:hypothetical protein